MVGARFLRTLCVVVAVAALTLVQSCAAEADALAHIVLPPGFAIEVYADVPHEHSLERVQRYRNAEQNLHAMPEPEVLDIRLPSATQHGPRHIDFGPDGKLYITIGAPCNVCDREGYGQIVRNSVGLAWHPETGDLWFTDNGRGMLGDDLPPDELDHAPLAGLDLGFPYCHAGEIPGPEFGAGKRCEDTVPPAQKLGPHVVSLGLAFYTGSGFPAEYRGQIFIAEHGSWNRSKRIGYRVSLVRLRDGKAAAYEVFADGWLQGQSVMGRPVDLLVLDDGSMLLSDDHAGNVYRIRYEGTS